MLALPLVTSQAETLLAYVVLTVALAALAGAIIGLLVVRSTKTTPFEETAEWADMLEHERKAA